MSHLKSRLSLFAAILLPCTGVISSECLADSAKIDQVLSQEATGTPVNRREALAKESDNLAQWQAGRIFMDGQWQDLESVDDQKLPPKIAAYRQQRDSQKLDIDGHRRMARWCQSHQLNEMADVHWKAVVALDVNDAQARKALKHKQIGNQWFTQEELTQAAEQQDRERIALKKWMPKVRSIVNDMQSGDSGQILDGTKALEKIDTEDAISALMYGALQLEPSVAVSIVSKIKSMRSTAACLALCQIALNDPNSETGRTAIEGLREYDEHFYIPELLNVLEAPVKLQQEYFFMPNGSLATRRAYLRETMNEKQELEIIKLVALREEPGMINRISSGLANPFGMRMTVTASPEITRQVQQSLEKVAAIDIRREQRVNENQNSIGDQRARNSKVILSSISGLSADAPVESYWDWWPSFNENPTGAAKPTTSTSYLDDSSYADIPTGTNVSFGSAVQLPTTECLVAGTKIQTSTGLRSVEELKIGDQVVSMDVSSGEISLRPIVSVGNRTASESYKLTTKNGDLIQATGGHNWWVLGKGWLRTRQLAVGQFLRTGGASQQIDKIEKIDGPITVYNMIVDQTHTYFVGKDRLLSWDVTTLKPTLQTVPGRLVSQRKVAVRK